MLLGLTCYENVHAHYTDCYAVWQMQCRRSQQHGVFMNVNSSHTFMPHQHQAKPKIQPSPARPWHINLVIGG